MANELISQKIKLPVSPENKAKLLECIEDEFNKIGCCVVDDDEIKVTKIKSMLNLIEASAAVTLKEKEGNYAVYVALVYKPTIIFWLGTILLCCLWIIVLVLFCVGKNKLIESVNNAMKNVEQEF